MWNDGRNNPASWCSDHPVVSWVVVFLLDGWVILIYGCCCVCGLGSPFWVGIGPKGAGDCLQYCVNAIVARRKSTRRTFSKHHNSSTCQLISCTALPSDPAVTRRTLHPPPFPPHHFIPCIAGMPNEVAMSQVPVDHVSPTERGHWTCFLPSSHPTAGSTRHAHMDSSAATSGRRKGSGRRRCVILNWPPPGAVCSC